MTLSTLMARAAEDLAGRLGEAHDPFPTTILEGLQNTNGASSESLLALQDFTYRLFVFDMPKNFFIQMAIAGACICILIIAGGATIVSRIVQRSFWVFKVTRRSEGLYLVPNALNTFLLFEAVFAFIWLTFIIVQYYLYWLKNDRMVHNIATLNLIVWWPLWIGAFMAAWGSFYTAPGALDKGPLGSSKLNRFMPKPLLINIFCVATPLVLIISLIPLIVLSQTHMDSAFSDYQTLARDIQALVAGATDNGAVVASRDQASAFLSRADAIWDKQVNTGYYLSIGYSIWPVWAGIFLALYIPAGGYLTFLVWQQVRKQKATLLTIRQRYIEDDAIAAAKEAREEQERRQTRASIGVGSPATMRQIISLGESGSRLPDPSGSLLFQPLTSSQMAASTAVPEQGLSPPVTPSTVVNSHAESKKYGSSSKTSSPLAGRRMSAGGEQAESDEEVFFPPLRPEVRQRAAAAARRLSSVGGTPYSRYKYLRRCFINLTILYVAVCFGATLYLGVSASLGRSLHASYKKGPQAITDLVYGCCVATAWGAVVCGSCAVFAIMARLIDPANAPVPTSREDSAEKMSGGRGGGALRRIAKLTSVGGAYKNNSGGGSASGSGEAYGVQDKTRTLPAVPESVGATVDEMMFGGASFPASISQQGGGGGGAFDSQLQSFVSRQEGNSTPRRSSSLLLDVRGHRPPKSTRRPQAYKMDLHARPGEALVFEPSFDPTSSSVSHGMSNLPTGFPESQTASMAEDDSMVLFAHPRPPPPPTAPSRPICSSDPMNDVANSKVARKNSQRKMPPSASTFDESESMLDTYQAEIPLSPPMTPRMQLTSAAPPPPPPVPTSAGDLFVDALSDPHHTDDGEEGEEEEVELIDASPHLRMPPIPPSPSVPSRFAAQNARAQTRQAPSAAPRILPRRESISKDSYR